MPVERDQQRFELALASSDPATALYELAKALKAEGVGQVAMYPTVWEHSCVCGKYNGTMRGL